MNLIRLIRYDIRQGLLKQGYRYLWVLVVMVISSMAFRNILEMGYRGGTFHAKGTWMDYYLYAMKGMESYKITQESVFRVPICWFLFHIMLAYHIGDYAESDLKKYGRQVMMKSKTRMNWWFSKCIWCVTSVCSYYLVAIFVQLVLTVVFGGSLSVHVSVDIMKNFGGGLIYLDNSQMLMIGVFQPIFISCAVSMVQLLTSMVIGSVQSYAFVCILYVLSAYYTSPYLIGNYTMWVRNNTISVGTGIYALHGILLAFFLINIAITGGIVYIDKMDILE